MSVNYVEFNKISVIYSKVILVLFILLVSVDKVPLYQRFYPQIV